MRVIKHFLLLAALFATFVPQAQSLTFIHDQDRLNAYGAAELGVGGRLTPDYWYATLHRDYAATAHATAKSVFRVESMEAVAPQKGYAEDVDSVLSKRAAEELKSVADRQSTVDPAWLLRSRSVEQAVENYNTALSHYVTMAEADKQMVDYFTMIRDQLNEDIEYVRTSYQPTAMRLDQYVQIEKDAVFASRELVQEYRNALARLYSKRREQAPTPKFSIDVAKESRTCINRWITRAWLASKNKAGNKPVQYYKVNYFGPDSPSAE